MKIALLTGASSGLGCAYANYIGEVFPEIEAVWALARRKEKLDELAKKISSPRIVPVECDLTKAEDMAKLKAKLAAERPEIVLLINNAGCGYHGAFSASDLQEQMRCVHLNVSALTEITRMALDYMPAGARVLNTCSIASFAPNANMAVYSATKAYVSFFSRALDEELRPGKRSSTIVCPAPMKTEFLTVGHIEGNSKTFELLPYCDINKVARGALKAAKRRRRIYTPRVFYKFFRFLARILPDCVLLKLVKT
ncbi:MAG: SDR family NAD(P)-dependent oxidoreductase [Clostridia bacterium]|nr:SDR family NAD(P)-dependent oxidoreductase [Clostridia bacterium]